MKSILIWSLLVIFLFPCEATGQRTRGKKRDKPMKYLKFQGAFMFDNEVNIKSLANLSLGKFKLKSDIISGFDLNFSFNENKADFSKIQSKGDIWFQSDRKRIFIEALYYKSKLFIKKEKLKMYAGPAIGFGFTETEKKPVFSTGVPVHVSKTYLAVYGSFGSLIKLNKTS